MKTQFQLSMLIPFTLLLASLLLASAVESSEPSEMNKKQAQERLEMEMEKGMHQPSAGDAADKTRERTRATEEKQMAESMDDDKTETSRRWWEFWK